jgi:1-acyl-sn-glycerol-3-phosphate acyltransferase
MVAINEDVPVVPVAIHGSYEWRPGNFRPVSIAWGMPMTFEGLPRGGRGYREASAEIERELAKLSSWLEGIHALGRPAVATPPA